MGASERINILLNCLNISAAAFALALGKSRPQFIYDIQKGKTKNISQELAKQIVSVYPEISEIWLLTGDGEMLKSENPTPTIEVQHLQELIKTQAETISSQKLLIEALYEKVERLQRAVEEKEAK